MASRRCVMATVLLLASGAAAAARMRANSPALAVRTGDGDDAGGAFLALSVTGTGFAAAPSGLTARGRLQSAQRVAYDLAPTDPRVVVWTDVQIVAKLPADLARARATVDGPSAPKCAAGGALLLVRRRYDTAAAGGPNGPPAQIAIDLAGRVWVNPEFKRNDYYYDPASDAVVPALYPTPWSRRRSGSADLGTASRAFQRRAARRSSSTIGDASGCRRAERPRGRRATTAESSCTTRRTPDAVVRAPGRPERAHGHRLGRAARAGLDVADQQPGLRPREHPGELRSRAGAVRDVHLDSRAAGATVDSTFDFATTATCDTDGPTSTAHAATRLTHACRASRTACVRT